MNTGKIEQLTNRVEREFAFEEIAKDCPSRAGALALRRDGEQVYEQYCTLYNPKEECEPSNCALWYWRNKS